MKTYQNGIAINFGFGLRIEGLSESGDAYTFAQKEKQFRKIYSSKFFLDFSIGKWF